MVISKEVIKVSSGFFLLSLFFNIQLYLNVLRRTKRRIFWYIKRNGRKQNQLDGLPTLMIIVATSREWLSFLPPLNLISFSISFSVALLFLSTRWRDEKKVDILMSFLLPPSYSSTLLSLFLQLFWEKLTCHYHVHHFSHYFTMEVPHPHPSTWHLPLLS